MLELLLLWQPTNRWKLNEANLESVCTGFVKKRTCPWGHLHLSFKNVTGRTFSTFVNYLSTCKSSLVFLLWRWSNFIRANASLSARGTVDVAQEAAIECLQDSLRNIWTFETFVQRSSFQLWPLNQPVAFPCKKFDRFMSNSRNKCVCRDLFWGDIQRKLCFIVADKRIHSRWYIFSKPTHNQRQLDSSVHFKIFVQFQPPPF